MSRSDPFDEMEPQLAQWRHYLHAHPETAFEEHETAAFLVEELTKIGLDVHTGIAGTGVVAVLRNGPGRTVGLRADIDALDVEELTGLPYASKRPGKMHACGHDGHTTMMLGAARAMVQDPPGPGTVVFIFQPAEENEGGAREMISDGLFERFPVDQVFSLHNWPGLAEGAFAVHHGPVMAAMDNFELRLVGRGAHGAMPHQGIDPISIAAQLQTAWQSIVSRAIDPTDPAVISVTQIHAGDALNVIPEAIVLKGTVRSFLPATRDLLEAEMEHRASHIAQAFHANAEFRFERRYPATINDPGSSRLAETAATTIAGAEMVKTGLTPSMASEDFAFMLERVPGAYIWIGNGPAEGGRNLHSPHYQFNDNILAIGARYFCEVTRLALIGDNR